ncbi:MAG: sugar porter family MFS transporter, partial [archaeon]|nr:sugar porter family MFS transporter [archaeon]
AILVIADKKGRKPALILNIIGMVVCASLITFSWPGAVNPIFGYWMYKIGQSVGVAFLAADIQMLIISEDAPRDKRGIFVYLVQTIGIGGSILGAIIYGQMAEEIQTSWRVLLLIPFILGIIMSLVVLFSLKETSVYSTMKLRKNAELGQIEGETTVSETKITLKMVRKHPKFKLLMIMYTASLIGMFAAFPLGTYMEPFLREKGFETEGIGSIFIIRFITGAIITFILGLVNDRYGRKKTILINHIVVIVFPVLLIFCVNNPYLPFINILVGVCYGMAYTLIFNILYIANLIAKELFPTEFRSSVSVFISIYQFIFAIVAMQIHSIILDMPGMTFDFFFILNTIPFSIVGLIILMIFVPETKGTDLVEIK